MSTLNIKFNRTGLSNDSRGRKAKKDHKALTGAGGVRVGFIGSRATDARQCCE
jgi:hypothetical protein